MMKDVVETALELLAKLDKMMEETTDLKQAMKVFTVFRDIYADLNLQRFNLERLKKELS